MTIGSAANGVPLRVWCCECESEEVRKGKMNVQILLLRRRRSLGPGHLSGLSSAHTTRGVSPSQAWVCFLHRLIAEEPQQMDLLLEGCRIGQLQREWTGKDGRMTLGVSSGCPFGGKGLAKKILV